jgi:hypothetical protein
MSKLSQTFRFLFVAALNWLLFLELSAELARKCCLVLPSRAQGRGDERE